MENGWNGAKVGDTFAVSGLVAKIEDDGVTLKFRVDTDGVLRTVSIVKAEASIRIQAPGTITITEAPNA
jgi:hypothetical protein